MIAKSVRDGKLHLVIDSMDDLWALRTLIRSGDLVTASTTRTAEAATDKIRAEKLEKKRMHLGVRVEDIEWHDFDDHLRVHGTIETGPQDHSKHHTLILKDPGSDVRIEKPGPLTRWQLELVDAAVAETTRPRAVLVAIDDEEAQFGQLTAYGLRLLGTLRASGQGKRVETKDSTNAKKAFYDEVAASLQTLRPDSSVPLLVVGPGWWREEFLAHAARRAPAAVDGALTDGVSQGGAAGLREALKRGMVAKLARDHRVQVETEYVEDVFARIAKSEGLVAYGPAEVAAAAARGAIETLLVADTAVRAGTHDDTLRAAEAARAKVHVVSTGHDAGHRLASLGGIAALLRFRVD
jgi:protein pelota